MATRPTVFNHPADDAVAPICSVYIPTKNRIDSLTLAIRSVQAQALAEVEILVVDDGSTDGTPALLAQLAAEDPRIRYVCQPESRGACAARNLAIRAARGQYVTGLDDDDEFHPHHLSALLNYWQTLERAGVEVSCLYVQYLQRKPEGLSESAKRSRVCFDDLFDANYVGNQVFAPRDRFIAAGLFDEAMPAWQDLEFFYRILKMYGPARLLDAPTYLFDLMPRDDRISTQQKAKILKACQLMFDKHGGALPQQWQRLLLQVYSPYYGFPLAWSDFWRFVDRRGSPKLLVKFGLMLIDRLRSRLRHG